MDGSTGVWILGGYQSDFARNLTKEGQDFASLSTWAPAAQLRRWGTAESAATAIGL